jgi:hypothetical protein
VRHEIRRRESPPRPFGSEDTSTSKVSAPNHLLHSRSTSTAKPIRGATSTDCDPLPISGEDLAAKFRHRGFEAAFRRRESRQRKARQRIVPITELLGGGELGTESCGCEALQRQAAAARTSRSRKLRTRGGSGRRMGLRIRSIISNAMLTRDLAEVNAAGGVLRPHIGRPEVGAGWLSLCGR